jgi:transmembrane sensor
MDDSNFNRLLSRYLAGTASEQERIKIEAWLDVQKPQDSINLELTKEEEEELFQKITNQANSIADVTSFKPKRTRSLSTWILPIAASVLMLVVASFLLINYYNTNPYRQVVTVQNGVEKAILNDGTLVWLQPGSTLSYTETPGTRNITFSGQALFEVAKDAERPFTVNCGGATVNVLGTSFSLKTGDSLQLVVLTGKVNLTAEAANVNTVVTPNQKVVLVNNLLLTQAVSREEVSSITANTQYNMVFNDVPLAQVLVSVEQKFNVQVKVDGKQLGQCKLTANFTDQSLQSTLQLITEVIDITYTQKGNTIVVSGSGCQNE